MKPERDEGLDAINQGGMEEGRGNASQPWELEMLSAQEQMDRIVELLSRGVLRLIRQDKHS